MGYFDSPGRSRLNRDIHFEKSPQIGILLQEGGGLLGQGHNRLTHVKKLPLGVPHQLQKHAPLATALATKAPHDLFEVSLKSRCLGPQRGFALGALLRDLVDDLEDFFFALYSVWASVTRWLPCSLGNVSMTR